MTMDNKTNQVNPNFDQQRQAIWNIHTQGLCHTLNNRDRIYLDGDVSRLMSSGLSPEGLSVEKWRGLVETAVKVNSIACLKAQPMGHPGNMTDFYGEETGFHQYNLFNRLSGSEINNLCNENPALLPTAAVMVRELCEVDPVRTEGFQLRLKQVDGKIDPQVKEKLDNFAGYKSRLAQQLVETGKAASIEEATVLVSVASGVFIENSNLIDSADVTLETRSSATEHIILNNIQAAKETYKGGCSWCEKIEVDVDGVKKSIAEVMMTGSGDQISQIRFNGMEDLYVRYAVLGFKKIIEMGRKNSKRKELEAMEKELAPKGRDFFGNPKK